jgi:hypothetical protein
VSDTPAVRPRRIARRLLARAHHWGRPHVHCPSCGADNSAPESDADQVCFTCKVTWYRLRPSGDYGADMAAVRERVPQDWPFTVTWWPLMVDVPAAAQTKKTVHLKCAFVYFREPEVDRGGENRGWPPGPDSV